MTVQVQPKVQFFPDARFEQTISQKSVIAFFVHYDEKVGFKKVITIFWH